MDGKTKKTLGRITRNIPRHLHDVTRVEVDTSEEELARAALKNPKLTQGQRRHIAKLLDSGAFRREEIVIDEKKVAELDQYHEHEIAKARRAGMLADPKDDPFWIKRQAQIRQHNQK